MIDFAVGPDTVSAWQINDTEDALVEFTGLLKELDYQGQKDALDQLVYSISRFTTGNNLIQHLLRKTRQMQAKKDLFLFGKRDIIKVGHRKIKGVVHANVALLFRGDDGKDYRGERLENGSIHWVQTMSFKV